MTGGRVDQATVPRALLNHDTRIRALESLNTNDQCQIPVDWGAAELHIEVTEDGCPPSCCTTSVADAVGAISGIVWTPCDIDVFDPTKVVPGQMISGQVKVIIDDPGFFTIEADCLAEGDPDFPFHSFSYFYSIFPPWFIRIGEGPIAMPSFGFGTARQASTGLSVPAYLNSQEWGILIPGVDDGFTLDFLKLSAPGWFARPATSYSPAYPWDWAPGDTLFEGTFTFFYGGIPT